MPVATSPLSCSTSSPTPKGSRLLAAIVRHYDDLVSHVRQHIGRRGGDRAEAQDVVHDVCVELIERPPEGEIRVPLAFLREIASRRAIDRYRSETAQRQWLEHAPDLPECADPSPFGRDPALLFAGRERLACLAAAIEALPPRCRDVFVMHKIHQMQQAEVADQLGISLKTVEKHLRLGMAACRLALDDTIAASSTPPRPAPAPRNAPAPS